MMIQGDVLNASISSHDSPFLRLSENEDKSPWKWGNPIFWKLNELDWGNPVGKSFNKIHWKQTSITHQVENYSGKFFMYGPMKGKRPDWYRWHLSPSRRRFNFITLLISASFLDSTRNNVHCTKDRAWHYRSCEIRGNRRHPANHSRQRTGEYFYQVASMSLTFRNVVWRRNHL